MSTAYPWDDEPEAAEVAARNCDAHDFDREQLDGECAGDACWCHDAPTPDSLSREAAAEPPDEPAHDPATGEVYPDVDTETIVDVEVLDDTPAETITAQVVAHDFGDRADVAVRVFTTPTEVESLGVELRREVLRRSRDLIETQHRGRTWKGKPTKTDVAGEVRRLSEAHLVLDEIGDAFKAGAGELRDAVGDLVLAVTEKDTGTATVRVDAVPDPAGGAPRGYRLTRSQATRESVDDAKVIDVIVADLTLLVDPLDFDHSVAAFAQGVREGIAAWLVLAAAHTLKSSALVEYERRLAASDDPTRVALAKRLEAAHGKVNVGNARTKVERVTTTPKGTSA